ncbi:MAG: SDR family NAD(P)-dependent oxidoreductase, partial [Gammaproteobacteria bacterium]
SGGSALTSFSDAAAETRLFHKPSQAPLWGMGRVLMNEYPDLQCKLVDLQVKNDVDKAAGLLLAELLDADQENELILTDTARYVSRMQRSHVQPEHTGKSEAKEQPQVYLDFTVPGQLRHLKWFEQKAHELMDDEVEIATRATGLNFRDVMYAMGMLTDEAVENGFSGPSLGLEFSGVVIRIGKDVVDFKEGDDVIGFAAHSFSSHVVTAASAIAHKPSNMTFEEAATVPTAFFTVYYALNYLARLQPGEKILIHGAAGAVGIAAIQYARYCGAEVFATAGTDEKRDFVRMLGADHVMDSRSYAFADQIMDITDGAGIDVVLNSLAGEAITRNLSVLKPFGRFLELGKRDFYENSKIGLRPFKDNITYYGIDADQLMVEKPELTARLFREMMGLFEDGFLRPLPYRLFSARNVAEAFRYMQQSRQIGKIVVEYHDTIIPFDHGTEAVTELQLHDNGCYLVTGGLSGFGMQTARWLASKGAKHLVLVGRSGASTPEAANTISELKALGVDIHVKQSDVTEMAQLSRVFADIKAELPPLRGVIHAAMVLDDGLIRNMDQDRIRNVMAPKVMGAWNLHCLTEKLPLDFFVVYSSATTAIGNPGQANYVAANIYLESLVNYRRQQNLPALYAAWGVISDTGYLARNEEVKDSLQDRLGGAALTSDQALLMLEKLLASDNPGAAVINFDWRTIQRYLPSAKSPKFEELSRQASDHSDDEEYQDIHALIAGMSNDEIQELVIDLLSTEISKILRIPQVKLDVTSSVFDLGMDSLMGVELMMAVEERFAVSLPVMALSEGPTIARIAERIIAELTGVHSTDSSAENEDEQEYRETITAMAARHAEDLDESEIENLVDEVANKQDQSGSLLQ